MSCINFLYFRAKRYLTLNNTVFQLFCYPQSNRIQRHCSDRKSWFAKNWKEVGSFIKCRFSHFLKICRRMTTRYCLYIRDFKIQIEKCNISETLRLSVERMYKNLKMILKNSPEFSNNTMIMAKSCYITWFTKKIEGNQKQ